MIVALLAGASFAALSGAALAEGAAGNADAAKNKLAMCIGCHGIPGYKTAYPVVYHVPKIYGQQPAYIVKALQGYRSGERSHPSMQRHCQRAFRRGHGRSCGVLRRRCEMKRALIIAAAAALSLSSHAGYAKGNAAAGKAKAAEVCAACHGPDGNKPTGPDFPILAGQHVDYLRQALSDYKSGKRNNPIMKGFAATLSAKEMDDLAAWFASQPSNLVSHR